MSYDPPADGGAHDRGECGGYYKCATCAALVSAMKQLEMESVEGYDGRRIRRRDPTMTITDARRMREARRVKAKAARKARREARRRSA